MQNYKLLEPIQIGSKVSRNRIVYPALETRQSTVDGDVTKEMVDYYHAKAKGGAGVVIVENTNVDNIASRSSLVSSQLNSDHLIAGKFKVAEAIKSEGAIAIIQLNHGGRQASPAAVPGQECVAPSAIPSKAVQRMPKELTIAEIEAIEDAFATTAARAQQAGFDGIEIHAAHGYLICSFLSPDSNHRTDIYGGSAENRARIAHNVIDKTRALTGKDFIIGIRISGAEYVDGGLTIEDTTAFAKTIEDKVEYINVSAGTYETTATCMIPPLYMPQCGIVHLATAIKNAVTKCKVIAVNSITPLQGEEILKKDNADMIAFGRTLVADPDMPNKLVEGRLEDIRPCMRGHEGCMSLFYKGTPIRCEVNAQAGREAAYKIVKVTEPKNVVIVGGGMAGMESARVANLYGHKVTLIEKSDVLGGHFIEATEPSFKHEAGDVLTWLKLQVSKADIDVRMNTNATPELIKSLNPDAVILAVGSEYIRPNIQGIDFTITGEKAIMDTDCVGNKVVVIGGGLVGVETALHLANKDRDVTIIEMLDQIVSQDEPLSQAAIAICLDKLNSTVITSAKVVKIEENKVTYVDKNNAEHTVDADTIVAALGLGARKELVASLKTVCNKTYVIGDAVAGRKLYDCTNDAWNAVRSISDAN